jgi:hypothetical protein
MAAQISALPTAPAVTDSTADFNSKAFSLVAALSTFVTQANTLASEAETDAETAEDAATDAVAAQAVAMAAANYVGAWSSLSGAKTVPLSVSHSGEFWMLTQNIADVTTQTPAGGSSYWQQIGGVQGNATDVVNMKKGSAVASAASPDIWTAGGNLLHITGTTTTTGFAAAAQAGSERWLVADGAWPLTAGANLILTGRATGETYTCSAGDILHVHADTTTQFRVTIHPASGLPARQNGGTVLLESNTASASSSLDFTTGIDGSYDEYTIEFENLIPAGAAALFFRASTDAGSSFLATTNYHWSHTYYELAATPTLTAVGNASTAQISVCSLSIATTAASGGISGRIRIIKPASTTAYKHVFYDAVGDQSGTFYSFDGGRGVVLTTSAVNAFRLLFNGQNITSGTAKLYGHRKTLL